MSATEPVQVLQEDDFIPTSINLRAGGQASGIDVRRQKSTSKFVVVKVMKLTPQYTLQHFMKEAAIMQQCRHKNSVEFIGVILLRSGEAAFVVAYAGGGNLRQALSSLSNAQKFTILHDIVAALQFLHGLGVIHNDLKLENVLLDDDHDRARLTDYGSAQLDGETGETRMTRMMITKDYAAPEALAGDPTKASDIWSLGIILYEVAVEVPLLPSASRQLASEGFVDVSAIANLGLRRLVEDCFLVPAKRRPTIDQIAGRLVPIMFDEPAPKASPVIGNEEFRRNLAKAKAGDGAEQRWIGYQFAFGQSGVAKDLNQAVVWYWKAAESGNVSGMRDLGLCYQKGWGVAKDFNQAVVRFLRAADGGNTTGMRDLGLCYRNGWGVTRDFNQSAIWYRKAAEAGDFGGMTNLGFCYRYGLGVAKSVDQAAIWYRRAAEGGNAAGMFNVGLCYQNGWGVAKDFNQAVIWYRRAAEAGNADGMGNLGVCYENGWGVAKDVNQAAIWYGKAADGGNAYGMAYLADAFRNGSGVAKDASLARRWIEAAVAAGNQWAIDNRHCFD